MTRAGRALVRKALGEEHPRRLPAGTLRDGQWRTLALLTQGSLVSGGDGAYYAQTGQSAQVAQNDSYRHWQQRVTWDTLLRLLDYKWDTLCRERENIWDHLVEITPFGRDYYRREWTRYHGLYLGVEAPAPEEPDRGSDPDTHL